MQILLLSLVFVVSVFTSADAAEQWFQPPPEMSADAAERWAELAEGWDKVMALPPASEKVYIEVPESDEWYQGMGNGISEVEQWRSLVTGQFPVEQVENALCVIRSESGGNGLAKNPNSNARGLFQIMTSVWGDEFGWTHEDFYVPELNVYAAARIWERSGWVPWSPRTRRLCGL